MMDEQQRKIPVDPNLKPSELAEPGQESATILVAAEDNAPAVESSSDAAPASASRQPTQNAPETFAPPAIPLPRSIVSSHTLSKPTQANSNQPQLGAESTKNTPTWKKPRVIIGLILTVLFLFFECYVIASNGQGYTTLWIWPQSFFMAFYWSYCIFTTSGAFTYSSPAVKRYSRAWNCILAFFLHPMTFITSMVACQVVMQLLIQYRGPGQVNDTIRVFLWAISVALLFLPVLTTRSYYRFMSRLDKIAEPDKDLASPYSRLPASLFAACHAVPIAFFYGLIIYAFFMRNQSDQFFTAAIVGFPFLMVFSQIVSFAILRRALKKIDAKTHIF